MGCTQTGMCNFCWLTSSALAHPTFRQGQGEWGKCLQQQETEKEWKIKRNRLFSGCPYQSHDQVKKPTGSVAALGGVRREDLDLNWA